MRPALPVAHRAGRIAQIFKDVGPAQQQDRDAGRDDDPRSPHLQHPDKGETADQQHAEQDKHQTKPFFDEIPDRFSEFPQKARNDEEPQCPCDDGRKDENGQGQAGDPGHDRDDLEGERCDPRDQDSPGAIAVKTLLEGFYRVRLAVEVKDRLADQLEKAPADEIPEKSAQDRRNGRDACDNERL